MQNCTRDIERTYETVHRNKSKALQPINTLQRNSVLVSLVYFSLREQYAILTVRLFYNRDNEQLLRISVPLNDLE